MACRRDLRKDPLMILAGIASVLFIVWIGFTLSP